MLSLRHKQPLSNRRHHRGVAAVEFAFILPILIALLTIPIFFGRVLLTYSAMQKAAHDSAIYLSGIPLSEMRELESSEAAAQVAMSIALAELSELQTGGGYPILVDVQCDGGGCGRGVPTEVRVVVRAWMFDQFFNDFTWQIVGPNGIRLQAEITIPYIGA